MSPWTVNASPNDHTEGRVCWLKEDVIRICERPARNTSQRDIARFGDDGIMSRVFCDPPIVLLSPVSEPTEPAVKPD